jgi:hypothetical protein
MRIHKANFNLTEEEESCSTDVCSSIVCVALNLPDVGLNLEVKVPGCFTDDLSISCTEDYYVLFLHQVY